MLHWLAIYTQPNQELFVNRQMEERDLEVYLPVLQFVLDDERGLRLEPFFPHFLFVRVDTTSFSACGLQWLPGVRSIVAADDQPLVVPDSVIHLLQRRIDTATKRILRTCEGIFSPGQQVDIATCPYHGFEALFQEGLSGDQRVQIWLDCMGVYSL